MQDDVLGLWGEPAITGKPAGADLIRGKKSLPVLLALADDSLAADLTAYLTDLPGDEAVAQHLVERMAAAGHRAQTQTEARGWAARALGALDALELVPGPRAELAGLAQAAVERDR